MKDKKWIKRLAKRLKNSFVRKYKYESKLIDFMFIAKQIGKCPSHLISKWNIDHIIPLSSFADDIASLFKAWSIENLTWLPARLNGAKSNRMLNVKSFNALCTMHSPSAKRHLIASYIPKLVNQM